MKLRELHLHHFGPFQDYALPIPSDADSCILIVGKNNAGKTTIIRALHLINSALQFARNSPYPAERHLPRKDIKGIDVDSMIYHLEPGVATIEALFDNGKVVSVHLNSDTNSITCHLPAYVHGSSRQLFAFLPPLGQFARYESILSERHVIDHINTTLAPLHFRNHLYHLVDAAQYSLIQQRLEETWEGIQLQRCEYHRPSGFLTCLYKEGDFLNEIALAGQGLQIWLQILTHLTRLSEYPVLILDEPEIFLHPEKQNDLIRLIHDYYAGTAIIATHSTELMSNVDITHIIHVQKDTTGAKARKSSNLHALETARRALGSNINIHASQFEDVDTLLFTEHKVDYDIVMAFASRLKINTRTQNIGLSGSLQWKNYEHYQLAYKTYYGKDIDCSMLLDRDYFPPDFHQNIIKYLQSKKVRITFTPGKEIENLFLEEEFLAELVPSSESRQEFRSYLDAIYQQERDICFLKYAEFARNYSDKYRSKDITTVYADVQPNLESIWNNKAQRHNLINGKKTLAKVRNYFRTHYHKDLPTLFLADELVKRRKKFVQHTLSNIL